MKTELFKINDRVSSQVVPDRHGMITCIMHDCNGYSYFVRWSDGSECWHFAEEIAPYGEHPHRPRGMEVGDTRSDPKGDSVKFNEHDERFMESIIRLIREYGKGMRPTKIAAALESDSKRVKAIMDKNRSIFKCGPVGHYMLVSSIGNAKKPSQPQQEEAE